MSVCVRVCVSVIIETRRVEAAGPLETACTSSITAPSLHADQLALSLPVTCRVDRCSPCVTVGELSGTRPSEGEVDGVRNLGEGSTSRGFAKTNSR